jgi:histone H3/H4
MAKTAMMMLVKSAVKDHLKGKKMMCSGDLFDAVNEKVADILDSAAARTKSNGRSTVRAGDV